MQLSRDDVNAPQRVNALRILWLRLKELFWSAVINGVVAVPLMVVIILLVSKKSVMGAFTAGRPIIILGWIATAVMGAAAVRMFIPG